MKGLTMHFILTIHSRITSIVFERLIIELPSRRSHIQS